MKKTFSTLGIGAGLLVVLSSCQSSDFEDYPGGYEEAMPMSELAIGDDELPPWVLEGDDSEQVAAGDYTDDIYAVPTMEDIDKETTQAQTSPTSQNQPAVAATPQEDVIVDRGPAEHATYTPKAEATVFTPTAEHATIVNATAAASAAAKPAAPSVGKPVATTKKPAIKKPAVKKPATKVAKIDKSKVKTVDKPTLVTYKVKPGDSLSDIAKRSNTTVAQIRKDSNIKGDIIHPGQIIKVRFTPKGYKPGDTIRPSSTYTVKRGESLSGIAKKHGVTTEELMKANNLTKKTAGRIYAGKKLNIPGKAIPAGKNKSSASSSYTVKRGESLSGIAKKHGVTTEALMQANGLSKKTAGRIQAGQKLVIPGKATAATDKRSRAAATATYTVKRGDSISVIAKRHGLTTGQLLKANKMTNADATKLRAGATLIIPAKK